VDDISAPDFIGDVASGIKDGTGGGGVKPLLNDCGPRPVGSSVHDVNKHQSDVNMMSY
jgi:hypothetical protein